MVKRVNDYMTDVLVEFVCAEWSDWLAVTATLLTLLACS